MTLTNIKKSIAHSIEIINNLSYGGLQPELRDLVYNVSYGSLQPELQVRFKLDRNEVPLDRLDATMTKQLQIIQNS